MASTTIIDYGLNFLKSICNVQGIGTILLVFLKWFGIIHWAWWVVLIAYVIQFGLGAITGCIFMFACMFLSIDEVIVCADYFKTALEKVKTKHDARLAKIAALRASKGKP